MSAPVVALGVVPAPDGAADTSEAVAVPQTGVVGMTARERAQTGSARTGSPNAAPTAAPCSRPILPPLSIAPHASAADNVFVYKSLTLVYSIVHAMPTVCQDGTHASG